MSSTMINSIDHVSDTAFWVAYYRMIETERPDALFCDDRAKILIGDRGAALAQSLHSLSEITQFHVVIRTALIDRFIVSLVQNGVDTILCLGAGLDTRPYRLSFSSDVKWIEVDYPHLIEFKNRVLAGENSSMKIERISLDLADRQARQDLFARIGRSSNQVLVLTEGVLGYLSETQVGELADDLYAQRSFQFWIGECHSPLAYRFMKNSAHRKAMKNAPFQFMPKDWFRFFESHRWKAKEIAFLPEEAKRLGRPVPKPLWAKILLPLMPKSIRRKADRLTGYVVYERESQVKVS